VEGPAGSGKTTVCKALTKGPGELTYISNSLMGRTLHAVEAPLKSSRNDFFKVSAAAWNPIQSIIIDRLFLSQLVYQSLREPKHFKRGLLYIGGVDYAWDLGGWAQHAFSFAQADLFRRSGKESVIHYDGLEIWWLVLLPSVDELNKRRGKTKKAYPWSSQQEIDAYEEVLDEVGWSVTRLFRVDENTDQTFGTHLRKWLTWEIDEVEVTY
jgi:hypothetical protein